MRRLLPPILLLAVFLTGPAHAAPEGVPPLDALTERISLALGGVDGGTKVLEAADQFEFVFRRTLREVLSDDEITADHLLVREAADRVRLDVRIVEGDGSDSATLLFGDAARLIVEGKTHDVSVETVRSRLLEFAPAHLFSVPLAFAADGRRLLGNTDLMVTEKISDGEGTRIVLVASDESGAETARIEVDARSYRPVSVSFRSPAGRVSYRYGDYREVAPGLIVPFERSFSRNDRTVSTTKVLRFRLRASADPARFTPEGADLPPIPKVPKGPKP